MLTKLLKQFDGLIPGCLHKYQERVLASPLACRFAKGAFWSIFGAVVSRGLTLLASIFVARLFGKTTFGELGMIQSTVGTVGTFAGLGLGMASTKYVANFRFSDPDKVGRILALSSLISLITASIVSIGLIVGSSQVAMQVLHAPHLSLPLAIGAGLVFFGVINGVQTGALSGFETFQTIAKINLISGLSSFPLILLGAWFWGLNGAVLGMVLSMTVNWGLNNQALRVSCRESKVPYIFKGCWSERLILWEFTLPAALSCFLTTPVIWFSNVLLVSRPDGYAEMGIFSAAQQWQSAILFLPVSLAPMVLSVMANTHGGSNGQGYWKIVKLSFIINFIVAGSAALVVSLLSKIIMQAYGQDFSAGWLILTLLAITAVLIASINVIGQVIASSASMWWGFVLNFLWAVVFIVFSLIWVKSYGAVGLASAYVASYICHLIWTACYLRGVINKKIAKQLQSNI